ncbi:YceH family protein [Candidatus Accumulibacter sp. ACC003]|uniref:YceH family protein n=1 Tax=Candidatus Accumulibacter sp. ACC003 TaxID=2823334 RepID=UPI0025C2965B|nr:YceH family protein [Candidatus Accumulibacter sp. ACC003]
MSQVFDSPQLLSLLEARILGVLIEKEKTTPDAYPLTLNSLSSGCNQKSAREPVISVADAEVQAALEELRARVLVLETYGASGRVLRYAQNFAKVYAVPTAGVALLATLMLRGPQTVSELRANSERLYHFEDSSSVEAYLEELAARNGGALVSKLPRQAGAREQRWAHLLCGEPALPAASEAATRGSTSAQAELAERVSRLEDEVAELRLALKTLVDASAQTPAAS